MYVAGVVVVAVLMLDPSDQILLVSEPFTAVHRLDAKRLLQAKPSNTDMLPKQGQERTSQKPANTLGKTVLIVRYLRPRLCRVD